MANTVYSNFVLQDKITDLLTTYVNTRSLMTIDNTLAENAGMKKTINTYTYRIILLRFYNKKPTIPMKIL